MSDISEENKNMAAELLFLCPVSGQELRPERVEGDEDGLCIWVSSKCGDYKWKHTIKTDEYL